MSCHDLADQLNGEVAVDLSEFADRHLGPEPGQYLSGVGPASMALQEIVGNETYTHPLIGSLFWQAFTQLDAYSELLRSAGLLPQETHGRQEIVVRHTPPHGHEPRYDLVVLDPRFVTAEPAVFTAEAAPQELADAAIGYWHGLEKRSRLPGELGEANLVGGVVAEASGAQPFRVLVSHPPETVRTAIAPAPAWEVVARSGEGSPASAGVVATDQSGLKGVTSADHAFDPAALEVTVAGLPGTIRRRHPVSDSCFIEVVRPSGAVGRDVSGPLSGKSPREGDAVTFNGVSSGPQSTIVTGHDKGIPFEIQPWGRLRVLTRAVTNPGDSGAALLGERHLVIGFAFDRTGYGAAIEYSAWVWAEFVYMAHGLH